MSGLCGLITFDGSPVEPHVVETMARAAPHRGLDGTTLWSGPGAALAHQARHLLPGEGLRPQPVTDGGLVVVADARLDNRAELCSALGVVAGHSAGGELLDAELLLAAYHRWGGSCAERLVGDYAFVVYDVEKRQVFAARDPMGMRALAYRLEPGRRLLFGTEVKQILAAPDVPARLFEPALAADLVAQFGDPSWSFYEGINLLPPGHHLSCDAAGSAVRRFWDIDPSFRVLHDHPAEYAEHLRSVFTEAVAARLRTDQTAGILLSGGVDSTSAASTAGWLLERGAVAAPGVHACCWAFESLPECDERHVSRHIVDHYGLGCTEVLADDAGPLACFPEHLSDQDDPMLGGFQPLIEHSLNALREAGAGVVLGGDRGDLVVGDTGYSYLRMAQAREWSTLAAELRSHRQVLGDPLAVMLRRHLADAIAGRLRRRSAAAWLRWGIERARGRGPTGPEAPGWVRPAWLRRTGVEDLLSEAPRVPAGLDSVRAERYRFIFTQVHVRGVAWSERTYARYGLGFADPFSDVRLARLALAVPPQIINRPGDQSKPWLREAMTGVMPEAARRQADKIVPRPLYEQWLRHRAAPVVHELLDEPLLAAHGCIDAPALRAHYEDWLSGRSASLAAEFWWALATEVWLRRHWDSKTSPQGLDPPTST